jgi:DNA-binding winged helix-turn-helix (wHTH) protein
MAFKNPLNQRSSRIPQEGPAKVIELNQNLEGEPFSRTAAEKGSRATLDDHRRFFPVLQALLERNDYRVVFVPRNVSEEHFTTEEQPAPAARAVLLPSSWREMFAEFSEFIRDSTRLAERRVAKFADFCVDFIKVEVSRMSGEVITLTNQEFKTLKCLVTNPGRVFSRDELLNEAWGYQNYPTTRTVDNHILKLRQKLERDPGRPVHFLTVHSVGYKFVP